MKKWLIVPGFLLAAGFAFFAACKKNNNGNNNNNNNLDRKPMLTNYANNYIVPAYAAMLTDMNNLKTKIADFTTTPSPTTLTNAQDAWRAAYMTWQKVDLVEFGPAEDVSLRMYMNIYPVTLSKLNANISSGSYNLEEFGNKDASGFAALDYLLNGIGATPAAVVTYYTTDAQAANRKAYLQAVVNKMTEKVQAVNTAWTGYKTTFVESTGTDVNSGFSKMVNGFVLYYERYLRAGKIGLPGGAMSGVAKPDLSEAYYTPSLGKELAVTALTSVKNFYEGRSFDGAAQGESMKSYLMAIGTKDNGKLIADIISDEVTQALNALNGLTTTIKDGVTSNRPAVLGVYEQMQEVVPLIKVDMVSAFGISITYTDNDGD